MKSIFKYVDLLTQLKLMVAIIVECRIYFRPSYKYIVLKNPLFSPLYCIMLMFEHDPSGSISQGRTSFVLHTLSTVQEGFLPSIYFHCVIMQKAFSSSCEICLQNLNDFNLFFKVIAEQMEIIRNFFPLIS